VAAPVLEVEEPAEAAPVDEPEAPVEEPVAAPVLEVEEPAEAAPVDEPEAPVEEPVAAPVLEAEEPVQAAPAEEPEAPATESVAASVLEVEEPADAAPAAEPAASPAEEPVAAEPEPEAETPQEAAPPAPPSLDQPVESEQELSVEDTEPESAAPPTDEVEAAAAPSSVEPSLNVVNGTNKNDFVVGTKGDDQIAGLRGNDKMTGGAGDDVYVYSAGKNGSDVFDDGREGDGYDVAVATENGVVIGVDGYADGRTFSSKGVKITSTGVDAFEGQGDTIIRDGNSSRTLDFSNTELNGILEIDAGGGADKVYASDLSDASYRGGAGNDSLYAGDADATWLYGAGKNGADKFYNGEGFSVAQATGANVVIGVNGYANGVDAFEGQGDTIIRDGNRGRTLDFSNTELNGVLQIDAAGGADEVVASNLSDGAYRGGSGNDSLTAGSQNTTWLYSSGDNGYDSFADGAGHSVAMATGADVVIGVNGYANGVDAFEGQGDTIIRDGNRGRTLDFSNTELNGVLEVDAGGGADKVVASNLSDGAYRGGAGDDTLTAGSARAVWLYGDGRDGRDSFINGEGVSIALAEDEGVVIGVNGYADGVDGFRGAGDTIIQDGDGGRTLDFSNTAFKDIALIDGAGGADTIVASDLSEAAYRGGAGNDSLTAGDQRTVWVYDAGDNGRDTFVNGAGDSIAQATEKGVVIGVNGYADGVDGFLGVGDTIIQDGDGSRTLDFSNTALKDVALIDGAGGADRITVSNLSEGTYSGGAGDDVFVVGRGAESATIVDFDDAGADRLDLSAFGVDRTAIQGATSVVDYDGDGEADDVQIDLGALGGENGSTLTLLDADLDALNFGTKKSDFIVGEEADADPAGFDQADDGAADKLFTFDADSLDADSGWTAALDGGADPGAGDGFFAMDGQAAGMIVFEDGSDQVHASIADSQW
jgi:hypothetical protein